MNNNMTKMIKDEMHKFAEASYTNIDAFLEDSQNIEYMVSIVRTFVSIVLIGWILARVCECCEDPFGEKTRKRLRECEFNLEESENTVNGLEEELKQKTEELESLKVAFQKYKDRYVSCKQAAQRFIDTHASTDPDS
jgi:1,2-phenylacetyl-CoA epoxidase catalytic subunit